MDDIFMDLYQKGREEQMSNFSKMLHNVHAETGDLKPYSNSALTDLIDYTEKSLKGD